MKQIRKRLCIVALAGVSVVQAAFRMPSMPTMPTMATMPTMQNLKDKLELTDALVKAAGPILLLQYKKDPVKLKQVQEILAMIGFVPTLMLTMEELKTTIPTVPKETLSILETTQVSLKQADAEFKAAAQPTQSLDDQTQKVLGALKKLQTGLEAPGSYLVELNEKTFAKMVGLFEDLPTLGNKMTIDYKGKPVKISQLLKGLFSLLKTITDKYSVGFKGMEMVINKLIAENEMLKAEVARLKVGSTAESAEISIMPVIEQHDAIDLSDLF